MTTWYTCYDIHTSWLPSLRVCVLSCWVMSSYCYPKDYCPPGSSVHGILKQEYWSGLPLVWVDKTQVSYHTYTCWPLLIEEAMSWFQRLAFFAFSLQPITFHHLIILFLFLLSTSILDIPSVLSQLSVLLVFSVSSYPSTKKTTLASSGHLISSPTFILPFTNKPVEELDNLLVPAIISILMIRESRQWRGQVIYS